MKLNFLISKDGSHTLLREDLNETYHSHNGALHESRYVFIEKGLQFLTNRIGCSLSNTTLNVLEIGFGTGLNALLTYQFAEQHAIDIHFVSLEPYPVPFQMASQLNYTTLIDGIEKDIFLELHRLTWNENHRVSTYFSLEKIQCKLEAYNPPMTYFDCVFYDAFAPNKQPEVWQLANIEKTYRATKQGGVLVTYCAQGQFKRNLKQAGYDVESLAGAPPKREMVRAHRSTI